MKYIKLFENWSINKDGLVDVDGSVRLNYRNLTKLPLQFGRVTGNFDCSENKLTTLEGAPKEVRGDFRCNRNRLTSLEGAPEYIGGDFYCFHNNLTSLKGAPNVVGNNFNCLDNNLITLEGGPQEVGGDFTCRYNYLTTLKGAPEYIVGEVNFLPNRNLPIELLEFIKESHYTMQKYILYWQSDYSIWRRDGSFNKANFIRLMEDAKDELKNIKLPK